MQVRQLDHVQLAMPVGREDDAKAFYQAALGIPKWLSLHILRRAVGAGLRMIG